MRNPFRRSAKKEPEQKRTPVDRAGHKRFAVAQAKRTGPNLLGQGLSADETLRRDLLSTRLASRKAGEDNGYITRYLGMVQTHIVGEDGFKFQSKVKTSAGDLDKAANDTIESAFARWSKIGVCEVSGLMSRAAAEELIIKSIAQDGDVLIRHIYSEHNEFGYSIQIIEADLLDITLHKDLENGNRIRMGVELDSLNRRVAFHVLTNHPGDYSWTNNGRKYIRIPASEISLPFPMWRPGQNRGVPWAHAALLEMHSVKGLKESEFTRSRIAASNMVMYERDPEQEAPDEDEDWDTDGDFIDELEPGTASIVPEGYRTRETNFTPPNTSLDAQVKTGLRGGASGLEVNYNALSNDYEGVSFSTMRQAVLEDRDHWKRKQRWFREAVLEPIFTNWLKSALLNNALTGLNAWDVSRLDRPSFSGRRWAWVDPLKDEQAVGEAFNNFTTDPIRVYRDKGLELQEVKDGWTLFLDEMEPVMERAQALGFGRNLKVPPAPPPKDDKQ